MPLEIACLLSAKQLTSKPAGLIVFPEGCCQADIDEACRAHPEAVVVGAIARRGLAGPCDGILMYQSQNRIKYSKICGDGRTSRGSGDFSQHPVYEANDLCVGVLICMDADIANADVGRFRTAVIEKVASSSATWRVICIPAQMHDAHFSPNRIAGFSDVHVVLCNDAFHNPRCRSFVTDTDGNKIAVQVGHEPLVFCLQGS